MHPCILGELGMKGGHQVLALLDQHRVALIRGEHADAGAHAMDDGGSNEDRFELAGIVGVVLGVDTAAGKHPCPAMERELVREKHVMRYAGADDFGLPATAFLICRFWLIDAWWSLGRYEEARELFVDALAHRNRFGLLSEDIDPQTGALWGNFPQTYSMAGLILSAMRLSRSWEDRYWR